MDAGPIVGWENRPGRGRTARADDGEAAPVGAKNGRSKRERQGLPPKRARRAAPRLEIPEGADAATRAGLLAADAAVALSASDVGRLDDRVLDLVVLAQSDPHVVDRVLWARLVEALDLRWQTGWQPTDLDHVVRQARLHPGAGDRMVTLAGDILGDLVAADLGGRAEGTVDPTWAGQLAAAEATCWWPADRHPLAARVARDGVHETVEAALRLEHVMRALEPLQQLGSRPGQVVGRPRPDVDDRLLERVRRLLAKAESTTFEAEAETFTAAAQKLMARHSIDRALLATDAHDPEGPQGRRVWLDNPYAREKMLLLGAVADANRSQSVWSKEEGFVTLLGFEHDLGAVETLYTSLLVQATRAMHAEGRRGGERTRDFRAAFLAAYATRIGERLAEATAAETAVATSEVASTGRDLVPVLAERAHEVETYTEQLFGELRSVSVTLSGDPEGWVKGRRAADAAEIAWGPGLSASR